MHIQEVDERDSAWEDGSPRFRVYIHHGPGPGGSTSTFDLTGCDLLQALDWAQRQVPGGATYAIALVTERPWPSGQRGLVWLVGIDGNTAPWNSSEDERLRRMTDRSTVPVVIPPADRWEADR